MKIQLVLLTAAFVAVLLNACSGGSDESPSPIQFDIDFNSATTDWIGGFSDYTPETQPGDVVVEPRSLPQPTTALASIRSAQTGAMIFSFI